MKKKKRNRRRIRNRHRRRRIQRIKSIRFSLGILLGLLVGVGFLYTITIKPSSVVLKEVPDNYSKEEFIEILAPYAVELNQEYGVLPSIILAQAILESDWGQSELSAKYNNLFGMKAYDTNDKIDLATKEFEDGNWIEIEADFKVYPDWQSSLRDHTMLFVDGVNWNPDLYSGVLAAKNYKTAAKALQKAGYATDPDYDEKIIGVIESHKLYQYDIQQTTQTTDLKNKK